MRNSLETRLGLFFAVVVLAGFTLVELSGGGAWWDRGIEVRARFKTVSDLKVGDPVRLAGVAVGHVSEIRFVGQAVEVVLRMKPSAALRADSTAQIRFTGLLGQNFVAVDFGTPTALPLVAGAALLTQEQPDLAQIFEKFNGVADGIESLTKSLSGDQLRRLFGPMTDLFKTNRAHINGLMANFTLLSARLVAGQGTLGLLLQDDALYVTGVGALTNMDALTVDAHGLLGRAGGVLDLSADLVREARGLVSGVERGEGSLGKLVKDDTLAKESTLAGTNLREVLEKSNVGQGTVAKVVNDDWLLRNVTRTLHQVNKVTKSLEDVGTLSVAGSAAQMLLRPAAVAKPR